MYAIDRLVLREITFMELGRYDDHYLRPYRFVGSTEVLDDFSDAISGATRITPDIMAPLANRLVVPSIEVEGKASILNGWDARRARFRAVIQVKKIDNSLDHFYEIQGYTDHFGFTQVIRRNERPALDPEMILHINSVQKKRIHNYRTPRGTRQKTIITDAYNLVIPDLSTDNHLEDTYSLRPEDVLRRVQMDQLTPDDEVGDFDENDQDDNNRDGYKIEQIMDISAIIPAGGVKSYRHNASATRMVSNVLDGILTTVRDPESDNDLGSNLEHVIGNRDLRSGNIKNDEVLTMIAKMAGIHKSARRRCDCEFTWKEFSKAFPDANEIYEAPELSRSVRDELDRPGQYAALHRQTPECLFADQIARALPGYLTTHGFTSVAFTSHNDNPGGVISIAFTGDIRTSSDMDDDENDKYMLSQLEKRIIAEILIPASYNSEFSFEISVYCQINGKTAITVSINGQEEEDYCVATFADSSILSVISKDDSSLISLARGFNELIDHTINIAHENDHEESNRSSIVIPNLRR